MSDNKSDSKVNIVMLEEKKKDERSLLKLLGNIKLLILH